MRRAVVPLVVLVGIIAVAVYYPINNQRRQEPAQPPVTTEDRIPALTKLTADQAEESARAVANYLPKNQARIDDLDASIVDLLRQLPGVVQVEVGVKAEKPAHRIVHLRSLHFVPKDLYAIDMKNASGKDLSTEETDRLHEQLLLEVEIVELEQMALLRCLINKHGLRSVFSEGLASKDMPDYRERIAVLRNMEKNQITELRKQLGDVLDMMKVMEPKTDRHVNAKKIETEITGMIDQHRHRLLEVGVPGRLLIAGEIEEVMPLEDADALAQAKPVAPDGKMRHDQEKLKARRDAQVRAVQDKGGFGLIVLGGSHNLSDNVRRLGQGKCEYIRVTTKRFKEFAE